MFIHTLSGCFHTTTQSWGVTRDHAASEFRTFILLPLTSQKIEGSSSLQLQFSFQTALVTEPSLFSLDNEQVEEEFCSSLSRVSVPVPGKSRHSASVPTDPAPAAGPNAWSPPSPLLLVSPGLAVVVGSAGDTARSGEQAPPYTGTAVELAGLRLCSYSRQSRHSNRDPSLRT